MEKYCDVCDKESKIKKKKEHLQNLPHNDLEKAY